MSKLATQTAWLLVILAAFSSSGVLEAKEDPVCLVSEGGNCVKQENDDSDASELYRTPASNHRKEGQQEAPPCRLYLADSHLGGFGIFSGVDIPVGADVGTAEIAIPMIDVNLKDPKQWHTRFYNANLIPELTFESNYNMNVFAPGLGWPMQCHQGLQNVDRDPRILHDSAGVHRSTDPSAGSFSYFHNFTKFATTDIRAGDELFLDCPGYVEQRLPERPKPRTLRRLETIGYCIDNLYPDKSTIPGAGRGAFATRFLSKGSVVSPAPVIPMHRRDFEILEQEIAKEGEDAGELLFRNERKGDQLLMNYVFADPKSDVVLLPSAPVVNFINHNSTRANVKVQWSSVDDIGGLLTMPAHELLKTKRTLFINYVALRDIDQNEEIFLDYGELWDTLWKWHVKAWNADGSSGDYVSATEFQKQHETESVRTRKEQRDDPYPDNIITACIWEMKAEDEHQERGWLWWREEVHDCLRPCEILSRRPPGPDNKEEDYRVRVWQMNELHDPPFCRLSGRDQAIVMGVPRRAIRFLDTAYSTDMHLKSAFRREIGAPPGLFPESWSTFYQPGYDEELVELALGDIEPGEISLFRWANENNEVLSDYAFRVGLPAGLTEALLAYCDRMGITEKSRSLVIDGNPLPPDGRSYPQFDGYNWFIIRPSKHYNSNMHWISPDDEEAQEDLLRVLGDGGFDQVLESIGEHFGLDGLFCYQLSLMVVSECTRGYIHFDFTETNNTTFNVIFPLLLVDGSPPELLVRNDDETMIGEYNFEFGVAAVMGDDAEHGTAAIDYREEGEMRLMMSVYITDVANADIEAVMKWINQSFPPADPAFFYDNAGRHWKRGDPSKKLPRGGRVKSDFVLRPLEPNEIDPFRWADTNEVLTEYAFRIGLSPELTEGIMAYADRMGITDMSRFLVIDGPGLDPGEDEGITFQGYNWYAQRTAAHYKNNMHWLSPNDEEAQVDFLRMLGSSGFDGVLSAIGNRFDLNFLQCYHLSFMLVSHTSGKGFIHKDFTNPEGKVFNVIIPLVLANETRPELYVLEGEEGSRQGRYRYEYGVAAVMGDTTYHGTAEADYRRTNEMRLVASVYIAEITEGNIRGLMETLTQPYPPPEAEYFFSRQGIHWSATDPSRRLPTYE